MLAATLLCLPLAARAASTQPQNLFPAGVVSTTPVLVVPGPSARHQSFLPDPLQKQSKGVREVLQAVEDALVDAGYDDFVVATERGTFHWRTVECARAEAGSGETDSR